MSALYLAAILARDLRAVRREVEAYPDDVDLWRTPEGITNPGGMLARHLAGNIRHFIGAVLGGGGYQRDRESEFGARDIPRAEILAELDRAVADVERVVPVLPDELLAANYPMPLGRMTVNTMDFLMHLSSHLGYHLGQIDYHRRIITRSGDTVNAAAIPELASARKLE